MSRYYGSTTSTNDYDRYRLWPGSRVRGIIRDDMVNELFKIKDEMEEDRKKAEKKKPTKGPLVFDPKDLVL